MERVDVRPGREDLALAGLVVVGDHHPRRFGHCAPNGTEQRQGEPGVVTPNAGGGAGPHGCTPCPDHLSVSGILPIVWGPWLEHPGRMVNETGIRPWGSYTVLDEGAGHKVKRIVVEVGKRLSYQFHQHRAEHWFVVQGDGVVTLDGNTLGVGTGRTVDVPTGVAHRIENVGAEDLVFIEVQHGEYFGEDDIVRLRDDFGRATI